LNNFDNVTVFDFAIGRAPGEAAIFAGAGKDIGGASLYPGDEGTAERHVIQVCKLNDVMDELRIRHARLCKMDIEGSEIDALDGMKEALARRAFAFILIEVNAVALRRAGHEPAELVSRIKSAGYTISDIQNPRAGVEPADVRPFGNYVCHAGA
jgi:FkbM family methyltransferase